VFKSLNLLLGSGYLLAVNTDPLMYLIIYNTPVATI